jgi:hypothetical protein
MVKLNFVGDVGLFRLFQDRGIDPFNEINLPDSDFNTGNFEFIIPNNREKYFFDVSDLYTVDYDYFKTLSLTTFNAFGMANNHIMDYGKEGISDVINVFESKGIYYFGVGTDEFNVLMIDLKGILFAFIAVVKNGRWSKQKHGDFGPDSYNNDRLIYKIRFIKRDG